MKRVYGLSLIALLLLSSFVIAAGSSTRTVNNTPSNVNQSATCEGLTSLRERIQCRIDNPSIAAMEAYNAIEEACRNNDRVEVCQELYERSEKCYYMNDSASKKRCFLIESGININAGGTFRAAPDDQKRNYVVLLLYELQERIEDAEKENKITSDQASDLIAQIVEIKKMILNKEPRASIVIKINKLKEDYRAIMAGASA